MNDVVPFFNSPFFVITGGISTIFMIIGFSYTIYLVVKGVFPIWYKLGIGLAKRKIAIFAEKEYESLKDLIVDSKITKETVQIHKDTLKKAENYSVFLVHWKSFEDKIDDILSMKKDSTALIIYAPYEEGRIENDIMGKINQHRNVIVVNFRGRLVNDILISMITTGYKL